MKNWKIEKLSHIAQIEREGIESTKIQSGTLYVGLEHIKTGGKFSEIESVENGDLASTKFVFDSRHILYGKLRPYLNKIARPNFSGVCSTDILPILPKEKVNKDYLFHYLRLPKMVELATTRSMGANLPRLSPKTLAEFEIPLPPLDEQKRIAAVLDKTDALREKRRRAITKLDQLLQSVFLDMFGDPVSNPKGWETIELGKTSIKFSDGPFGSNLKSEHYTENGVRVVRLQNIGVGKFLDGDKVFVSEEHFNSLPNQCFSGDVLIGTMGEPNLRACLLPQKIDRALNKADCVLLRPNPKISNAEYLCWLLNMPSTLHLASDLILGQTRSRISMGRLRGLEVPLPPLEQQEKFAEFLEKIEELRTNQLNAAQRDENLFQSLQQRAFAGELFGAKSEPSAVAGG